MTGSHAFWEERLQTPVSGRFPRAQRSRRGTAARGHDGCRNAHLAWVAFRAGVTNPARTNCGMGVPPIIHRQDACATIPWCSSRRGKSVTCPHQPLRANCEGRSRTAPTKPAPTGMWESIKRLNRLALPSSSCLFLGGPGRCPNHPGSGMVAPMAHLPRPFNVGFRFALPNLRCLSVSGRSQMPAG